MWQEAEMLSESRLKQWRATQFASEPTDAGTASCEPKRAKTVRKWEVTGIPPGRCSKLLMEEVIRNLRLSGFSNIETLHRKINKCEVTWTFQAEVKRNQKPFYICITEEEYDNAPTVEVYITLLKLSRIGEDNSKLRKRLARSAANNVCWSGKELKAFKSLEPQPESSRSKINQKRKFKRNLYPRDCRGPSTRKIPKAHDWQS